MPSERTQRRIDAFLDEADVAASAGDWPAVAEKARAVLAVDPHNEDAPALLRAAEANLGAQPPALASSLNATTPVPVAPTAPATPESFAAGRYHVRKFLGEGGKKRVFLAHDQLLDRDVAFALIKTEGLDATGRERITREAQAMGRMGTHPHVVSIFDIGEEGGAPYVVTELLGGGDVEGLIEKTEGPLPLARALQVAKDVCDGLVFAHAQGIVHRDLKPGNVWLTSDGVAKIGDFGLAVNLGRSRLTQHGLMVGTVAYMPPEQALGGEVTPQSDLYSLGAMLYELVTGKPPFQADDPTAVISQHINTPPVAPSWNSDRCPPDLEDLILRLLAKAPATRPASAKEVLAALQRVDPDAKSASHSDSSANPLDRLARGVFVGRGRELERLRAAFDEAFAGRGSVVMLVGEPGIGKTRTTQELSTYARMRGAKVFWGRAHEASGAPAYWPWVQVGRDYDAQTDEVTVTAQTRDHALDLQRLFPNLRDRFPGLAEPPRADSADAQFALFDAFSSFLRGAARDVPLVLVLDDLHWADRPTLRLLTHLARELAMARLLVVGTYRDTDLDRTHPLSQALAELNRESLFTRINLRGLAESETAAYIRDTAGLEPSAELVRRVHAETEGNPFFLSEVVRLMTEEGSFQNSSISDIAIPEGVKEALGRRLDRLSPEANELLAVASVVGRECTHALLAALTDFDDDTLLALVEEALRARVLEETGVPGEYRFTHALMQDALYSELSTARRVRMQGRVAETLERLHASDLDAHAAELACHFAEASVLNRALAEKAVRYAELAAQRAEVVAAWDEAARWYQQALASVVDDGHAKSDTARLYWHLSVAARWAMQTDVALAAFGNAYALLSMSGDALAAAELTAEVGHPLRLGRLMGLDRNSEALAALSERQRAERPDLVAMLRFNAVGYAHGAAARDEMSSIAGVAEAFGLSQVLADVVSWQAMDALDTGRLSDAEALYRTAAERYEEVGALAPASVARNAEAWATINLSGLEQGLPTLARSVAVARRSGATNRIDTDAMAQAAVHVLRARYSDALGTIVEPSHYRGTGRLIAAWVAEIAGHVEQAIQYVDDVQTTDAMLYRTTAPGLRSRLLMRRGDADMAREALAVWGRAPTLVGVFGASRVGRLAGPDDALVALGTDELAADAYRDLVSQPDIRMWWLGTFDHLRGRLAMRLGRPIEEVERHFRTGLEWCERERCPVEAGRNLQGLADVAEVRADHSMAMQHLDAAAAKFAEYGAKLYLDEVLAKKEFLKA